MRSCPAHVSRATCRMSVKVEGVREVAVFSGDGSRLAVCSLDGEVKIWSSATRTLAARFAPEAARGGAPAAAWSRVR